MCPPPLYHRWGLGTNIWRIPNRTYANLKYAFLKKMTQRYNFLYSPSLFEYINIHRLHTIHFYTTSTHYKLYISTLHLHTTNYTFLHYINTLQTIHFYTTSTHYKLYISTLHLIYTLQSIHFHTTNYTFLHYKLYISRLHLHLKGSDRLCNEGKLSMQCCGNLL